MHPAAGCCLPLGLTALWGGPGRAECLRCSACRLWGRRPRQVCLEHHAEALVQVQALHKVGSMDAAVGCLHERDDCDMQVPALSDVCKLASKCVQEAVTPVRSPCFQAAGRVLLSMCLH